MYYLKQIFLLFAIITLSNHSFAQIADSVFTISFEDKQYRAEEILSKYIQQKSYSGEEKLAGDFIKSVCEENGLYIAEFGAENGNYNFAASLYPLSLNKPNVILLNHIDVVHEGSTSLWEHPPFSGHISAIEVWGRGAFDNKGAAIMQLFSLLELKSKSLDSLPYNITFLAVSCEETMCDGGIDYVLNKYFDNLNPITVIGEGAPELSELINYSGIEEIFGISIGHKRPLWIQLELEIESSGHGSVTPEEYANQEMILALSNLINTKKKILYIKENKDILKSLGSTRKGLSRFILKHPVLFRGIISKQLKREPQLLALFTNTVTITSIESNNDVVNMIPQSVFATLDCRLLPNYPEEKFLTELREVLKNDEIVIKIINKMDELPISSIENEFYSMLCESIRITYPNSVIFPIILPNSSDVGKFRIKGVESYSIIPIELDIDCLKCIHAENERIPINALYQGITVYSNFLSLISNRP